MTRLKPNSYEKLSYYLIDINLSPFILSKIMEQTAQLITNNEFKLPRLLVEFNLFIRPGSS